MSTVQFQSSIKEVESICNVWISLDLFSKYAAFAFLIFFGMKPFNRFFETRNAWWSLAVVPPGTGKEKQNGRIFEG